MTNTRPRRKPHGTLSEFGPALVFLLIFIFIPTFTILRIGVATIGMHFLISQTVDASAKAQTFSQANSKAHDTLSALIQSPVARLCGLQTDSIAEMNLYIDEEVLPTGTVNIFGPNMPLPQRDRSAANLYEYDLRCLYTLPPMFPQLELPCNQKLPFVNTPFSVSDRVCQTAEFPDGMTI